MSPSMVHGASCDVCMIVSFRYIPFARTGAHWNRKIYGIDYESCVRCQLLLVPHDRRGANRDQNFISLVDETNVCTYASIQVGAYTYVYFYHMNRMDGIDAKPPLRTT